MLIISLDKLYKLLSFLNIVLNNTYYIFNIDFSNLINKFASIKSSS